MNKKHAAILLLFLVGFPAICAANSETSVETTKIIEGDSVVRDSTVTEHKGFFKRLTNYFKESNQNKLAYKKFDFSIIGGPHYASDVKFGIGIVAAGLFLTDRKDSLTIPSNISFTGDFSTTGYWLLGIKGNTFFKGSKYRFDYDTYFYSMPTKLWGIGYDMGRDGSNEINYKLLQTKVKADFMYSLAKDFYIGISGGFFYGKGKKFDSKFDDNYYLNGQKLHYSNVGAGIFLLFDSRDCVTAPYKGWFFKFENMHFPAFLNNKPEFNRTEFTLDFYHKIWQGGIMAYDLHGIYNYGNVPWTMMAVVGSSWRMRGYYQGRYRDKGIVEFQAELRQKIWRRIGFTVWGGGGNVFPKLSEIKFSQTLPNYGLGLRWEFKKRVNIRLDYGMGKKQSGFIFNVNEAF